METQIPIFEYPPSSHQQSSIIRDGYSMITEVLQEPLHELYCEATITPQYFTIFDVFPFACGAQRLAFKGSIYERIRGEDPIFRVHVVVKFEMATEDTVRKSDDERTRLSEEEANKTVRKHEIATKYANEWCQLGVNKNVYVLSTEKVELSKGCSLVDISQQRYPMLYHLFKKLSLDSVLYKGAIGTVEDHLPGRFTKFLNNDGNKNSQVVANFPSAFAHWTWVQSSGELMISDIQGSRTADGYILTDPCIHSVQDPHGYGVSDLGQIGIEEFFDKHKCNELCKDLDLGLDNADLDLGHRMRTKLLKPKRDDDSGICRRAISQKSEERQEKSKSFVNLNCSHPYGESQRPYVVCQPKSKPPNHKSFDANASAKLRRANTVAESDSFELRKVREKRKVGLSGFLRNGIQTIFGNRKNNG